MDRSLIFEKLEIGFTCREKLRELFCLFQRVEMNILCRHVQWHVPPAVDVVSFCDDNSCNRHASHSQLSTEYMSEIHAIRHS